MNRIASEGNAAPQRGGEGLGALCTILSAVLFGTMPLIAKFAYQHGGNACTAVFGRFGTGALISLLLPLFIPGFSLRITRRQMLDVLKLSIFYALTPILLYLSYNHIGSGLATTLHFTYPIMVIALMALFFRSPLTGPKLLCAALCTAGVLLLYSPAEGVESEAMGMALAVASGLTFALYIVLLGHSSLGSLPATAVTFWLSAFAAAEVGAFGLLTEDLRLFAPWQAWAAYWLLGLFATVLAISLFQKGVFLCGEVKASLLSNFEPMTGVAIGILLLGETLTLRSAAGISCILIAAALTSRIRR